MSSSVISVSLITYVLVPYKNQHFILSWQHDAVWYGKSSSFPSMQMKQALCRSMDWLLFSCSFLLCNYIIRIETICNTILFVIPWEKLPSLDNRLLETSVSQMFYILWPKSPKWPGYVIGRFHAKFSFEKLKLLWYYPRRRKREH